MNKKANIILIIAAICVLIGATMKLSELKYDYIPTLIGMLLGLIGIGIFFEGIKKNKNNQEKK